MRKLYTTCFSVAALLNAKRLFRVGLMVLVLGVAAVKGWGQQVIGSFPTIDGGFEGQTSFPTQSSIGTGTQMSTWSIQNTTTATATLNATGGRSGFKYATFSNGATSARIQSPTVNTSAAIASSIAYTIQYFYRTSGPTAITNFQPNISVDGTANPSTYSSATMSGTNNGWTIRQISITTQASSVTPRYGIGIIRLNGASAASVDIDDYVIYAGAADVSAPNSVGTTTISNPTTNSLDVAWDAASGGVDGGGYVVVRYAASPNSDNDPNQNGIYAVGNTTTNGTGSLAGSIQYVGTGLGFTDNVGLSAGTTYYYKVYTVDKAFNYADEIQVSGTTTSLTSPSLTISGTTSHGSVCTNSSATAIQYTITNNGTVQADGIIASSNDPQFVVSGLSSTTIAASGGTATYYVTFTPTTTGAKTATITISSTTTGSNSPISSLTGTGSATVAQAVSSVAASSVTFSAATLNGNVTILGVCPATIEKGFVYSVTSINSNPVNGGTGVTKTPVSSVATGAYTLALTALNMGTSYSFKGYVYDGTTYTYGSVLTFTTLTPPGNDDCSNAISLTVDAAAITGTLINATYSSLSNEPYAAYSATGNGDVWYKFIPLCTGTLSVTTTTSSQDIDLYIFDASCPLNASSFTAQGILTNNTTESVTGISVISGNPYYVRVAKYSGTSGTFTIRLTSVAPAQPGAITPPNTLCVGVPATYSVTAVSGLTYTWTIPSGWSGSSTSNSISVTPNSSSGTISVIAVGCGNSTARTLTTATPGNTPVTPGIITQPSNPLCEGSTGKTYSITAVTGATSYTWSVSGTGWSVTAGGTSISATITIGTGSGTVSVTANNTCGSSAAQTTGTITPSAVPSNPSGIISGPTSSCGSAVLNYSTASATQFWQNVSNGTDYTKSTTSDLIVTTSGSYYVKAYNGSCSSVGQVGPYAVTINTSITIDPEYPSNSSVSSPFATSFTVAGGITGTITGYQWQLSDDGGITWTDITTSSIYSNVATPTLSISNSTDLTGNQYRCVVTGPCGAVNSNAATLTVNPSTFVWTNPITGSNPSTANPFTTGDSKNNNILVSGIGRGTGISPNAGTDRYNASAWNGAALDVNKYFAFTLTPNTTYKIDFTNFVYSSQKSSSGPVSFALRSSVDNYATNLATTSSASGATFSLSGASFQNVISVITFRLYAWGATDPGGTFSINDFTFNGSVSVNCVLPALPVVNGNVSPQTTSVFSNAFLSNWAQASGATGYSLDVSTSPTFSTTGASASGIYISEYVEGSSSNKYLEIFNGTGTSVDLSKYQLRLYANGSSTFTQSVTLSGTLANGNVIVYKNSAATLYNGAAMTSPAIDLVINFNGNDAIALFNTDNGSFADIFGRIGENPGTAWTASTFSTLNKTLKRKPSIVSGVTTNPGVGFQALSTEWDQSNIDDVNNIGIHTFNGGSSPLFVSGYNGLPISGGATTNQLVSGLGSLTNYYYRIRATNACGTTANSNVVPLTTTDYTTADFRSKQTGNYNAFSTWEYFNGAAWVSATTGQVPGSGNNVTILTSHQITVDVSSTVGTSKTLTINSGGTIIFPATNIVSGTGFFILSAGATFQTASVNGITSGTTASGSVQVTGTRTFDGAANYVYNGSTDQVTGNGLPVTITGILTISNLGTLGNNTVTLTTNNTTATTLNLNAGLFAAGSGQQLNIAAGGSVNGGGGNWSVATIAGTLNFNSTGSIIPGSGLLLTNVNLNGGVFMGGGNTTMRGILDIRGGGFVQGGTAPTYSSSPASTLQYSSGNNYGANEEWYPNTFGTSAGVPHNVTIAGGTSLNFGGNNSSRELRGTLTFGTSSTFALSTSSGGDLKIKGDFVRNGTGTFTPNGRLVTFNGSAPQAITGSATFALLAIDQSTASTLTINNPITVTSLTLTSGVIKTTSTNLLILNNNLASATSAGNINSFVDGPLSWNMPNTSSTNYIFPVGAGSTYLPFAINNPGGNSAALTVQATNSDVGAAAIFDPNGITGISHSEYWTVSSSGTFSGGPVSLARATALGGLNAVARSSAQGGMYGSLGGIVNSSLINSNTVTSTNNTGNNVGYYVLASQLPSPGIASVFATNKLNAQANNTGYYGQEITITGSNFASNATVSFNGTPAFSIISNSGTVIKAIVNTGTITGDVVVTNPSLGTTASATFSILGYITRATGDWNDNGTSTTWLGSEYNGFVPVPTANSTVTINNPITLNAGIANAPNSVTITTNGTITFGASGTITVNNTLTNGGSIIMTSGGIIYMKGGSAFNNGSATFTRGLGTIVFNSGGNSSVTGTINFNDVINNTGLDFGLNSTISGIFEVKTGSFVLAAPIYATGSTLLYNTGLPYDRNVEWGLTGPGGLSYPYHVKISTPGTILNLGANGYLNTVVQCAGNLIIDAGTTLRLEDGTGNQKTAPLKVLGDVNIHGTLILASGTLLGGDIEVGGNWTRLPSATFTHNNRAVTFIGSSNSILRIAGGGHETFAYLTINKSGSSLILANNSASDTTNVIVNGGISPSTTLKLQDGTLDLNGLSLGFNSAVNGSSGNNNIGIDGTAVDLTRLVTSTNGTGTFNIGHQDGVEHRATIVRLNSSGTNPASLLSFSSNVDVRISAGSNYLSRIDFGNTLTTIKGRLVLLRYGVVSSFPPTYWDGSTLVYSNGGSNIAGTEWTPNNTSAPGVPYNVQVGDSIKVFGFLLPYPAGLSFSNTSYILRNNFTIVSSVSTSGFPPVTTTYPVSMDAGGGTLSIGGNWINNASNSANFTKGGGTVIFNGTSAQSIGGNNGNLNAYIFNSLVINNTSGMSAGITLNRPIKVAGILTLTKGLLNTSATDSLSITNTTTNNAISGGESTSFINGPVYWRLPSTIPASTNYIFPVGSAMTYLPFVLNNPVTGGSGATIQVEAFDIGSGGTGDGSTVNSVSPDEYWQVTASGNLTTTRVSLTGQAALNSSNVIARSDTKTGTYSSLHGNVNSPSINFSDATGNLGYFAIGISCPSRDFSYGSTSYCSNGGIATVNLSSGSSAGTFSATPAGIVFVNSSTGEVNLGASTPGTYTIRNSSPTISGCTNFSTATITVNNPNLITWLGVSTNWNTIANWSCGVVPNSASDVTIPTGKANYPVLTSDVSVHNIDIQTGASITISTYNLQIAGTVNSARPITATSGKVTFNGTAAQTIPAGLFTGNNIKDLVISNAADVTLGGAVNIIGGSNPGSVTVTAGKLIAGDYLTIKSDVNGTGRIAESAGSNYLTGNVIVERYIPAHNRRAYRLLGPSVNSLENINKNWQEGGQVTDPYDEMNLQNPNPGYGTHITGSTTGQNGFDATITGQPSLFLLTGGAWTSISNTNVEKLKAQTGYLLSIRGDRTRSNIMSNTNFTSFSTLRAKGEVLMGNKDFPLLSTGFTLVTNPYAAPIGWDKIFPSNSNIEPYYIFWDASIGSRGGYVSVNTNGDRSILSDTVSGSSSATKNIQSGQAFFVKSKGSTTALTIVESHKSDINTVPVFRNSPRLYSSLHFMFDGKRVTADGVSSVFDNQFSKDVDANDAIELANFDENVAILRNGKMLSIESRPLVSGTDTIPLSIARLKAQSYEWQFDPFNFVVAGISAWLEDVYLNTKTPIDLSSKTIIPFTVTGDAASFAAARFRIIFEAGSILPVNFTGIKAYKQNNHVQVDWSIATETNMNRYQVERSADGRVFSAKASVVAKANNGATASYTWPDEAPEPGNNYYRIKAISNTAEINYSPVVNVNLAADKGFVRLYPNPVEGSEVTLKLNNLPRANYTITLSNPLGQQVMSKIISHPGGSANKKINIGNLASGVYQVKVVGDNGFRTVVQLNKN